MGIPLSVELRFRQINGGLLVEARGPDGEVWMCESLSEMHKWLTGLGFRWLPSTTPTWTREAAVTVGQVAGKEKRL